ncbi:MAG: hypothetical protein JWO66_1825, partial [Candidatus Eremiobacteraeota bacterium]|nr:hypothetical protein [Candidatus Eremiobacteraeota bacterium]
TILGIIEGVIARWNPYQIANQGTTSKSQLDGSYFYSLSGTFGVAGMLSGSIDFAIIKASVNISIIITAQIVFTSYAPIVITVAVSVDVSASLEIDLGIFSITLHFHFSLDVNQTFTIGNPQGSAPWTPIAQQHTGALSEPLHRRLSSLRALDPLLLASNGWNTTPSWGVLAKDPSSPKLPLTAYLTFSLTASGDGATNPAGQQVCYVAMIALDAQTPIAASQPSRNRLLSAALPACIGTADTSFDALAKLVARWTVAAFVQTTGTLTCAQLDATIVTDDALKAIQAYLADSSNPVPIPTGTIETMLGEQVAVTLWGPSDVPAGTAIQGAFFPMPVELSLTTPQYGGQAAYGYTFGGYNSIAAGGVGLLRSYFDQLAVQVEDAKPAATANQAPTSVADFVFSDYFLLMARQMIAALRDGLRDFKYALTGGETPQFIVASVNTPQRTQFTVADLFAANAGVPLTGNKTLSVAGATATVQANDTFASVATTRYAGAFTATALATANVTTVSLLQPMQRVTYNGEAAVVDAGDSLTTLAARFKQTPTPTAAQLAADPGIQAQANLLIPFAKLALPPLAHTTPSTGTADTAATIAAAYGVSAASLGAPAADGTPNQNGSIANLFAPSDNRLDLPHLLQHTVGALIDEAGRTGATTRLSGMISRYHLHGLRLPTVQGAQPIVTPDALGMWVTKDPTSGKLSLPPTAGLYALTGQQFPLPPITAGPFTIQVGGTAPWLAFKNGTQTIAATVSPANPLPPGEIAAAPIEALRALVTAPAYRFVSDYAELGAQGQLVRTPATYGLGTYASWIAAVVPQLPYGTATAGAVPRIWSFPTALSSIVDQSVPSIEPRFTLSTQTYDEASRKTVSSPISNYGFASKVSFTIKRVPAVDQATASAQTYEVVGAGATDIVLLEEIVARFTSDASIEGLWLTFAPDPSLPAGGLQSGSASVAFGIGQGNLSTVTRPPGGGALAMALRGAAVASGPVALNGNAMFMRLLWEASITAKGGFYLYYDDAGTALPDHLFNKDGEAVLTALVVYGANLDNRLAACMNAAVVTDPFDPTKSALVAVAAPVAASYAFAATTQTLAQFADFYFADIADLFDTSDPKNQNATVALLADAPIAVNAGTYMVSPLGTQPGGDPSAIAAWFGTDVASLGAANPRLMPFPTTFAPFTALRLPPLTVAAGKTMNGTALSSLGAIASYFGADIVGLAVDNQTLPGLFIAKLYVSGGPVTRSSRLPMGSQLLELTRPVPPPVPPSTDPSYAANLMLNQFSMLGYAIGKNQDFDPSNLGVPVGPTGGGGTGRGKLRVPNALAAGDTWTYSVTLGYGSSMAGVPANPNPYYAVGRLLQVDFDWLDVYGNTIISDLSTPAAGDTGGLNGAPLLLGYTDALVGLGQWPSASAKWSITGPAGVPQLELHFSFDVTRYTGSDPKTNAANAQADALVYARLATQLADPARMSNPNAIAFSVATTLTTTPLPVAGTNLDGLTAWLTAIGAYLSAVAGGGSGTAPADAPLTFPMATSALVSAQLFELTCSFTLARTAGVVEGEFETVPGIRSSTTQLAPDGAATATGLAAFATNFETAFTLSDSMLKVAAGPDRYQGGAATSSTLWALRIGLAPAQGIGYKIHEKKPPLIFAPKPISNQLVSEPAPIYAYTTNTGIDFGAPNPPALSFANVDLDVWTRRIFAAVDDLLSPEFISALVILDEKIYGKAPSPTTMTNLRALTENKKALASMYAQQLEAVFVDQSGADATTVAAAFAQSMLEQLGNAYQTQAALQYSADVVAAIVEPPPTTLMPNLYGPVLQSGTPVPGIAFTATKIPLATANDVPLAFLVTTPSRTSGDTEASNIPVSLVYSPTNVEHQRASLPQIPGDYIASSWLQFVLPPPADPTDPHSIARSLGTVDIPMVLRSYPSNPALASQQGTQMYQGQLPPSAITQATQWTYGFTYSLPAYYPQDTVYATVVFNIMAPPPMMLASFADVFGWLAEFVTVYPDVERDLDAALRTLTPASTGAQVQTANVAIQSVNAMLGKITGVSHVDAKEHRRQPRLAIRPRSHGLIGATDPPWQFTLTEAQYGQLKPQPPAPLPADALVITVTSLAGPVPVVQLAGYKTNDAAVTPVPGATTVQYYFTQGTGTTVLAFDDAQTLRRTVQYPTLQILDKQDAQVNVHVTRNEKLVNTRVTNPDFVYRTADVTFQAPCLPSILYTGALDISQIAPSKPPAPRSLQAHLTALFTTLVSGASQSAMSLALSVGYQYTVNPSPTGVALPVTVPILMQPPLRVYWGTGTTPPGDVKLTDMIADVASAIATWFSTTQPSSVNGTLLFSLTVMASLTQTTMPLLRLTDLQLEIDDIAPPLIPPTPHLHAADRAGEA